MCFGTEKRLLITLAMYVDKEIGAAHEEVIAWLVDVNEDLVATFFGMGFSISSNLSLTRATVVTDDAFINPNEGQERMFRLGWGLHARGKVVISVRCIGLTSVQYAESVAATADS
jgi:hypothetical protein